MLFAVISSFVLAELGDKTMLATVALASDHNWAGVWIGATVGMVLADGVAIAVGALLHRRLPERFLHSMASVLFLLFGLWLLFDGALGLHVGRDRRHRDWSRSLRHRRGRRPGGAGGPSSQRADHSNRRRTRLNRQLATVGRTTDQAQGRARSSRVTCRRAD